MTSSLPDPCRSELSNSSCLQGTQPSGSTPPVGSYGSSEYPPTCSLPSLEYVRTTTPSGNRLIRVPLCDRCRLSVSARNRGILCEGQPGGILLVGIGPGSTEDSSGRPFIGRSGIRLRILCRKLSVPVAYTNLVGCRPPRDDPPMDCVEVCWRINPAVREMQPKCIVALGKMAASYLLGHEVQMETHRNRTLDYLGIPLIVTFHPAATLRARQPRIKEALQSDLELAEQVCRGEYMLSGSLQEVTQMPWDIPETCSVDVETTALQPWNGRIIQVGCMDVVDRDRSWKINGQWNGPVPRRVYGWNFSFDAQWLPEEFLSDDCEWVDGLLLHGLVYPEASLSRSLKNVGPRKTGQLYSISFSDADTPERMDQYHHQDLWETAIACEKLLHEVEDTPARKHWKWVMRLARTLARFTRHGTLIDQGVLIEVAEQLQSQMSGAVDQMKVIEEKFKVDCKWRPDGRSWHRSTKEINRLLFQVLGIPPILTDKGNPSTSEESRMRYLELDKTGYVKAYGTFLDCAKIQTSYIIPMLRETPGSSNLIDPDGYIHPVAHVVQNADTWDLAGKMRGGGTVTGRVGWSNPSVIVWPPVMRRAVISRFPNGRIFCIDLSQIEPRILAWMAGEEFLIAAFQADRDPYREIMSVALNKPVDSVSRDERSIGKVLFLATCMYGGQAGIARDLLRQRAGVVMSRRMCEDLLSRFHRAMPNVGRLRERIIDDLYSGRPIVTPTGRWRRIDTSSPDCEKQAFNYPIQHFAAAVNHAIVMRAVQIPGLVGLFTVHDSFEADAESEAVESSIREVYDSAWTIIREDFGVDFNVPIRYTLTKGKHWPVED